MIKKLLKKSNKKSKPKLKEVMDKISAIASQGYRDGSSVHAGYTYHPIPFKEFSNVPVHKTNCYEELGQVLDNLPKQHRTLLDIGSSVGFYSFSLRKVFDNIVSVEGDSLAHDVAVAVGAYKGVDNITYINEYLNQDVLDSLNGFDVVLMLNVHMWIEKQLGDSKTRNLLSSIANSCGVLFFQTASADSHGMYRVEYLKGVEDIKKYLEDCGFSDVELIAVNDHDGAPRYHFKAYGKK